MNILDTTNQPDPVQIDPNKNYLEELVGDGKKFKSPEELARGKAESDAYIEHMKARMDELRQDYTKLHSEYNAGPKLKETLDQYMQELKQSQSNQLPPVQDDKSGVFDEAKIGELVQQQIQAREQLRLEENNAKTVESKLQEAYGPNYKQIVSQQINQMGVSVELFNDLARKTPSLLYRTLGLEGQRQGETFQAPPTSTRGSDPFAGPTKRTNAYYQKMRQTDPVRYRDPKTQDQMYKDYLTLGQEFEDGDWNKYGHK
jgi:hypothetical protein